MNALATKATAKQPPSSAGAFAFLDCGPLGDGELELVEPELCWVEPLMQTVRHPLTQCSGEECASLTRQSLLRFLAWAPRGREPGDPARNRVPIYHFWMRLWPLANSPVLMAGSISLRVGDTADIQMYFGHVGYGVYPPARGRHLAERACRLLLPLARRHGLNPLWITTDPDNHPSRRTCERLGARLAEIVPVPPLHPLYQRGQTRKCRYCLDL
jgi:predicted acetyltransferase